jgi:GNAT superfamily N-acetyltransferase
LAITQPEALNDEHRLEGFRCSWPELTKWLIERARKNNKEGASRCFVVCEGPDVIGYYALAAGAVSLDIAPGNIKRNMPSPIPVVVMGRLAVHQDWVGKGIGSGLLKDAVLRTLQSSREVGIRALLCHAIDDAAKDFYLQRGFIPSPIEPLTLMLSLSRVGEHL